MPIKGRKRSSSASEAKVFLNVPYHSGYEHILLGLTAALVSLGRIPQLTFEVPDSGEGRIGRIVKLVTSCRVSIHDLSAVGMPVRFNMPFELGLAYAVKCQRGKHDILILERKHHRLDKHLSDLKGIDPKIHNGTVKGAICAVLEVLEREDGTSPSAIEVMKLYRKMRKLLPEVKKLHGKDSLFSRRVYGQIVTMAAELTPE